MAYNNYYPAGYQPMQYYPQIQNLQNVPQQAQQQNSNGIIWVQGEAGAKSYLVAPNSTVTLWDTESQTIYVKSADTSGMPAMKILDYTMRDNPQTSRIHPQSDYATKEDVSLIKEEIESLRAKFEVMEGKKK